jgi:hypothetical protein
MQPLCDECKVPNEDSGPPAFHRHVESLGWIKSFSNLYYDRTAADHNTIAPPEGGEQYEPPQVKKVSS